MTNMIEKAFLFALNVHGGQTRKDGKPYITHPFSVAMELAKNAMLVFNYLESNPIIEISKTAKALGIAFNTASSAVHRLVDAGILVQTSANSRNRTFAYEAYLDILRKGT